MMDFASRNQQSRFTRSINHPEVFGGQARHGVSKVDPTTEADEPGRGTKLHSGYRCAVDGSEGSM